MMIVMPTCDTHVKAAEASAKLLARYWPDHAPLHIIHHDAVPSINDAQLHHAGPQNSVGWLEALTGFLRARTETTFLLMLDDYGLCGPPRREIIDAGHQIVRDEVAAGMFALSWYPAHERTEHGQLVKLARFPVLLQAAIWRVDWFLELASRVHSKCSPWGFETAATQAAKRFPRHAYCADMPASCSSGRLIDGLDKSHWPLPYHNLMHRGRWDPEHVGFLIKERIDVPSRGLGDTVAKLTTTLGIKPCGGCNNRQEALNAAVPFEPVGASR